jgi:hypothetical protein
MCNKLRNGNSITCNPWLDEVFLVNFRKPFLFSSLLHPHILTNCSPCSNPVPYSNSSFWDTKSLQASTPRVHDSHDLDSSHRINSPDCSCQVGLSVACSVRRDTQLQNSILVQYACLSQHSCHRGRWDCKLLPRFSDPLIRISLFSIS